MRLLLLANPGTTRFGCCSACSPRLSLTQQRHASTNHGRFKVPDTPARTRFAPSPTGNLHLGSIRTALFNYLLARRTRGQFLLRIEDTDQKRTIPGAEERLYQDLSWAGLKWDEGPTVGGPYGPYKQSERTEIYRAHVQPLLASGQAYRCFCSADRLDRLNRSRHEKGLPLGYDRKCTALSAAEGEERASQGMTHVIRFRVPKEYPQFTDLVYGRTGHGSGKVKHSLMDEPVYDDPVLLKSDGLPTYHFANVVDDQLMHITHVIRGSEWMSSTPLHMALYAALGWSPPAFAHVPLLVDQHGQKLSKRNFDSNIATFREQGIFPDALDNFAALLGWSHRQSSDVMSLKELEQVFDLKITRGNTIVSLDKLNFLQEHHARRRIQEGGEAFEQMIRDVAIAVLDRFGAKRVMAFLGRRKLRGVIISLLRSESLSYVSPKTFAEQCSLFLDSSAGKSSFDVSSVSLLAGLRVTAATLCLVPEEHWTAGTHRANLLALQPHADAENLGQEQQKKWKKDLYRYLRWVLLDGAPGPSIPETMEILGKEICTQRIRSAAMVHASELMSTSANVHLAKATG